MIRSPNLKWDALNAVISAGMNGLTAEECAERVHANRPTIQARLSELQSRGKIIDSGRRRPNGSGKPAIVWIGIRI